MPYDDGSDHTGARVRHDVIAVNLTPLVARTGLLQVIGAVVDLLATLPVILVHVVAALPFLVLNVLLMLLSIVVMIILLGYGHQRRAADTKEDACGQSFLKQS
jgi:hypothetical protein